MSFIDENLKERLKFVDLWSKYVLEHDDKEWSKQQNMIINSCLRSSNITKELYLKMKKIPVKEKMKDKFSKRTKNLNISSHK